MDQNIGLNTDALCFQETLPGQTYSLNSPSVSLYAFQPDTYPSDILNNRYSPVETYTLW